jgi:hypothetical protein
MVYYFGDIVLPHKIFRCLRDGVRNTDEFLDVISDMMTYELSHYIEVNLTGSIILDNPTTTRGLLAQYIMRQKTLWMK